EKRAKEFYELARAATGFEYELTGALGKRTKFQEKEVTQLVMIAKSQLAIPGATSDTPAGLLLNDDILLEQTKYAGDGTYKLASNPKLAGITPANQPSLHPLDQAILLSVAMGILKSAPSRPLDPFSPGAASASGSTSITTEETMPYVSLVLAYAGNWSVHTMALLLRSRLEASRTRTVERSTLQLQALIDQMPTSDSTVQERLQYVYALPLPNKWTLEKEVGMHYLTLGVVRSAMEIFERLEMWEEVVQCFVFMEKQDRARAIVRDLLDGRKLSVSDNAAATRSNGAVAQLDDTRRAKLYCILGDLAIGHADEAIEFYQKAYELSGNSSSRASRSIGYVYFSVASKLPDAEDVRTPYTKAIENLRQSITINPLVSKAWFVLGCAYLRLENWFGAREAFSACVRIDDTDAESWANLASVYLRLREQTSDADACPVEGGVGDDARTEVDKFGPNYPLLAFQALKQALKHAYENWKIWSNYMIVAVEVGQMAEACRALGRVVEETHGKEIDLDVLDRLVDCVRRDVSLGCDALAEQGLARQVRALLENSILPRVSDSSGVFSAYAKLSVCETRWDDALKAWMDAYRCGPAGDEAFSRVDNPNRWYDAVQAVKEIVDVLRNYGPKVDGYQWRLQARSILRSFMGRAKDDFEDEEGWEKLKEMSAELKASRE
ncbi:TPR-like protein, partial [Fistulina hepatica ATCC 64428]